PAEHDARTAYNGSWLAVIGVALLIFMRGFDIWLEAMKAREELSGMSKVTAALSDVFKSGPWLEVSWFLIVPMALNALVLCPIVIKRASNAARQGGSQSRPGITAQSMTVAVTLVAATMIYFVFLAIHNLAGRPN